MKTIKKLFILVLCCVLFASNIPETDNGMITPYGHHTNDDLPIPN